ncbi:MAG: hypothetical protein ABGW88_13625 [Leeuwenhoekiella sp.]|uniref:hypothetical protein n=1 Tax=Leeuwenhoekiella sp. TaxID=1977054 RepID=UPI003241FE7D
MKEALGHIFRLLGSILLIVLALAGFAFITLPALAWKVYAVCTNERRKAREILSGAKVYFTAIAASFDQLGNAAFGGFFNWLMIDSRFYGYRFGDRDETVSEVLGWNEHLNTLSGHGQFWVRLLDKLEKDHCKKAFNSGILKARKKTRVYEDSILIN